MKAYSVNMRLCVLQAVDAGVLLPDVAQQFSVSLPSIRRWLRQRREQGHVEPKPPNGGPRLAPKEKTLLVHLPTQLAAFPCATGRQHCKIWNANSEMKISVTTMARALKEYRRSAMSAQTGDEPIEATQHTHQVMVDGRVIYEGDDWGPVFLCAGLDPLNGKIVHVEDGKPGAMLSPVLHQNLIKQTPS